MTRRPSPIREEIDRVMRENATLRADARQLRRALKIATPYIQVAIDTEEDPGVGEAMEDDLAICVAALARRRTK